LDDGVMWDTANRELSMVGRWLSPDPAGLGAVDPGNPQTWNRYAYVGGNPFSFTDPTGLGGPGAACRNTWVSPQCRGYRNQGECLLDGAPISCGVLALNGLGDNLQVRFHGPNGDVVLPLDKSGLFPTATYNYQTLVFNHCPGGDCPTTTMDVVEQTITITLAPLPPQLPWEACPWGTQSLCRKWMLADNLESDKQMLRMTKNWNWHSYTGLVYLQINKLAQINVAVDTVAVGNAFASSLSSFGIEPPPGVQDVQDAGIDYFEEVRSRNIAKIDQLLQSLAP